MYELLYIVPAPLTEKDLPNISKRIKEIVEKLGGKIIKEENLGNKKLAYPIKQVYRGFYLLLSFEIETEKLKKLDQKLKLMSELLRHLITKTIERKKKPVRPSLAEEEKRPEEKPAKKVKKVDLKKLGEKIDDLFKL